MDYLKLLILIYLTCVAITAVHNLKKIEKWKDWIEMNLLAALILTIPVFLGAMTLEFILKM